MDTHAERLGGTRDFDRGRSASSNRGGRVEGASRASLVTTAHTDDTDEAASSYLVERAALHAFAQGSGSRTRCRQVLIAREAASFLAPRRIFLDHPHHLEHVRQLSECTHFCMRVVVPDADLPDPDFTRLGHVMNLRLFCRRLGTSLSRGNSILTHPALKRYSTKVEGAPRFRKNTTYGCYKNGHSCRKDILLWQSRLSRPSRSYFP